MTTHDSTNFDRRTWMKILPALSALIAIEPGLEAQNPNQQRPQQPQKVTKEMLKAALDTIGLEFTEEQQAMMLPNINRNYYGYQNLRKVNVPLDTEPAFHFRPALPGKEPPSRLARFTPSKPKAEKRNWKSLDELAFLPVTELSNLVRTRQVSSIDLTKMYLDRMKKYSEKLLCLITLTEERALREAEEADKEIKAGRYRGPLHGIPYGAKDLFAAKGYPTTWGAEPYQNQAFDYDCTAIDRLTKAGAVLIGKLSMGALAQGDLWFKGMTRNPWNLEVGSSGSSAGSASATCAGLVGFSIGTETLGSIVSPSTRCGITGLRPTYGRVSRYGAMGLSWTMDKIGALCRSVEDTALVLNAMYGPDGHDITVTNAPLDWNPALPLDKLRIGYVKADFDRTQGDRKKIYDDVLAALDKAGVKMKPVEVPAELGTGPLGIILSAEAATAFDDLTRDGGVNQLKGQRPGDWPNSFRSSRLIPAVEYIRAMRARTLLQQNMDKFMADWDVLVTPGAGNLLSITNSTGHPQMSVPCGFIKGTNTSGSNSVNSGSSGVNPQSVVFTGKLYEEGTMLRVALAYEQATEWHNMHPTVDWA